MLKVCIPVFPALSVELQVIVAVELSAKFVPDAGQQVTSGLGVPTSVAVGTVV